MPAQNEAELETFEGWTLRVRPMTDHPSRLLLMLHGFMGDENSMWVFSPALPADYLVVAPRALYPVDGGGFSWRPRVSANAAPEPSGPVPADDDYLNLLSLEMFQRAVDQVVQLADRYGARRDIDTSQFDLMGFSQGGVMTNLTALSYPQRIRKAAILGGFLPKNVEELIANRPLAGKQIYVAHGTEDDKVPIERARSSVRLLEEAGAKVTYCEDAVAHKVSAKCLRGLKSYLAD